MKTIKVDPKEELRQKIVLREDIIEKQRKLIDSLRKELNKRCKWHPFWR